MRRLGPFPSTLATALAATLTLGCLALLPAAASASALATASIIGGKPGKIDQFPYIAHVEAKVKQGFEFACTGTVVAPRVVLTAGHCVDDVDLGSITPARGYSVTTGSADSKGTGGERFDVRSVHAYPGFDPGTLHGDAAILILDRPTSAPPVSMAGIGDSTLYDDRTPVQLAGWGLTKASSESSPRKLRTTSVTVQSPGLCRHRTRGYDPFFSAALQMCTLDLPDRNSSGCFGDSGGPAVARHPDGSAVEVGIVSTGGPACSTRLPNVFTRVDSVSTWVSEWIAAVESGAPPPKADNGSPLPRMFEPSAAEFTILTTLKALQLDVTEFGALRMGCVRRGPTAFTCAFIWRYGNLVLHGRVSPFYRRRQGAVVWNSHYLMRYRQIRCGPGNESDCRLHTRRG